MELYCYMYSIINLFYRIDLESFKKKKNQMRGPSKTQYLSDAGKVKNCLIIGSSIEERHGLAVTIILILKLENRQR